MSASKQFRHAKYAFYFSFVCILILAVPLAFADIYISEVLYDPITSESGGEAVELYNSGNEAINLSGYKLFTASSAADAVLPNGAIISPGSYYLIADANWTNRKDSASYPEADHEEAITLKNTDSGVALLDSQGNILDAVGWGISANINSSLYSGTPCNYSGDGESLRRTSFTGNNALDFVSSSPDFKNAMGETHDPLSNEVQLNILVPNASAYITNISFPVDDENKLYLVPGSSKNANLSFLVDKSINADDVYITLNNVRYDVDFVSSSGNYDKYSIPFSFEYYLSSGNYSIQIIVHTYTLQYNHTLLFEIPSLLAFEIDLDTINCNSAISCLIQGDSNTSTNDKPTIRNMGNEPLDFKVYASNLSSQSQNSIGINAVKFSFDAQPDMSVSNQPTLYEANLEAGLNSLTPFSLLINIPSGTPSGNYSTKLVFMGVAHDS